MTPGTLEADRLTSELVSPQSIFSTKPFSTLTASMSLLRIPSMLALHVPLEIIIPSKADITQVAHVWRIHCAVIHVVVIQVVVIHPEVHTTESHRQLKPVGWWGSIYRVKNVWKTFLTLHHFLGELHQSHSIFRSWFMHLRHPTDVFQGWEADICRVSHALELTPSVGKVFVTAATGFSWPSNDLPSLNLTAPLGFPWPGWPHHLLTWQLP